MPNIESLSFELLIDDKVFNERIAEIKRKADELNISMSSAFNIKPGSSQDMVAMAKAYQAELEKAVKLRQQQGLITAKQADSELRQIKIQSQERIAAYKAEGVALKEAEALRHQSQMNASSEAAAAQRVAAAEERKAEAKKKSATAEKNRQNAEARGVNISKQGEILEINKENAMLRQLQLQRQINTAQENSHKGLLSSRNLWTEIGTLATMYFSAQGAARLINNLVQVTAEFEKQKVALSSILQDADAANGLFEQIKDLAVMSPFSFKELVTYTKQLSAYSIPMNELYDTTKMLADVSAGLGVGMDRLSLAYGQIRSASFLRGQEVRQLTEAGIPILTELANQIQELEGHAISAGEVFDRISKRQVTFEMVEKVFKDMTSEGGKFYKMQEVLATTLSGKLSNLTDAYQIMFSEIGNKNKGAMVSAVDLARSLAENYEKIGRAILELVAAYGAYKASLLVTKVAEEAMIQMSLAKAAGQTATAISATSASLKVLIQETKIYKAVSAALSKVNPYAALASAAVALGFAIYKMATAETEAEKIQRKLNETVTEYNGKANDEIQHLDFLRARMEKLKVGTDEYNSVKKELMSSFGQYLSDIDRENLAIGNLSAVYDSLVVSIRDANKEKALSDGLSQLTSTYTEKFNSVFASLNKNLEELGIKATSDTASQLGKYLRGEIEESDLVGEAKKAFDEMVAHSDWALLDKVKTVNPRELRHDLESASNMVKKGREDLANELEVMYGVTRKNAEEMLTGWRKTVSEIFTDVDEKTKLGLTPESTTALPDYISSLKSEYERLNKEMSIAKGNDEGLYEDDKKRLGLILQIDKALHGVVLAQEKSNGTDSKTTQSINNVQTQIKAYQKLKDIYEELVQYMSQGQAKQLMATFLPEYGEMIYKDFDNEIINLGQSLANMGVEGKKSAEALGLSFGEDKIKAYIEALKKAKDAAKSYEDFMTNWIDSGELSDDEGFNISKVVAKYKKTIEQINQKKEEARKKLYEREDTSERGYGLDFAHEYLVIDDKALTEQKNALATANNDIKKQAELWVKNWEGFKDVDLSRFSDLTAGELKKVRDAIEAMRQDPLNGLPEKIRQDLENSELGIDGFVQAILDALDTLENKNDEQLKKTTADDFSRWADGFKEIASGLSEIGEASGNADLVDIAEQMKNIADTATKVVKALASGDTFGAIMAAASYVANAWFEAIAGAEKFKATLRDLQSEMLATKYASELALGTDTIFGDNTYASIKNASNLISKLEGSMNSLKTKFDQITVSTKKAKWWEFIFGATLPIGLAKLATNKEYSINEILDQMGTDLMTENGRVNVEALQALVDAYDGFSKAEKEAMETAIADAQAYNDALDQLDAAMESLTGSVAGDFASAIVEQWKSAGDAAADYSEILDDLATQYAEMMIKNVLLEDVFNDDFKKQITDLTRAGKASEVLDLFDEKVKQLENEYPAFLEILEGLDKYFVKDTEGSETSTLSNGIKSITEDTANLLASYINAIRADVAYSRMQLEQILGLLPSSPTLADYLMQIQANTYNTATATQAVLERIDSMMTTSDGPALRVFM